MATPNGFVVTRRHLKDACDAASWDLLDRLLELDRAAIDDDALYTDGWGDHWGLLVECVRQQRVDGVRVLLARGADRSRGSWGDGAAHTPLEVAEGNAPITALLLSATPVVYVRQSEPALPAPSAADDPLDRQGAVRDRTGLVFPVE